MSYRWVSDTGQYGEVTRERIEKIINILGGRDVRMFLPLFENNPADGDLITDLGPRAHHFDKHTAPDVPPYVKGSVLAHRLNGLNEAFDLADHDDFSMGADGTPANEPAFSLGLAVRFNDSGNNTLISRYDETGDGAEEEVEYEFRTNAVGRGLFITYDDASANYIGCRTDVILDDDRWYIIIGTYDGSCAAGGFRIYLDGARLDTDDITGGAYTAMHNEDVVTAVGYYIGAGGVPVTFLNGDVWAPFITAKELSSGEVLSLTNLYRKCLGI